MSTFNFNQPNIGNPELIKAFFAIHAEVIKLRTTGGDPEAFNDLLTKLNTYFTSHNSAMTQLNTYFTNFNALLTKLDADAVNTELNDTDYSATLALDVAGASSFADHIVDVAGAGSFEDLEISGSSTLEFVP